MNHPSRFYNEKHDYKQQIYRDFNHVSYWRLLYRIGLTYIALFTGICLIKQNWFQQVSYLNIIDTTILVMIPLIMAELILRRHQYANKRWNHMILLASFIIGLSSLGVFYS